MREDLTQEALSSLMRYDPDTGIFTRLKAAGRSKVGDRVGTPDGHGYLVTKINQVQYKMHRLAWLYWYGQFPKLTVDHINRDKSDNRIRNLREATFSQNSQNIGMHRRNSSGVKGVVYDKRDGKWAAYIRVNNRGYNLGRYATIEEARAAYISGAARLHTHNPDAGVLDA